MVSATFIFNVQSEIVKLNLEGHAEFDESGKDIVCAAISGLVSMLELGLLSSSSEYLIEKKKGLFIVGNLDTKAQMLVKGFYLALQAIEKKYKSNISIQTRILKE